MIPKINNATPLLTKITQKPKATAAITTGTLAVLSTRQAWPYCQGLEAPKPIGNPEDYELRWVNGIQTYVRKDIPIDRCPKVDVEDAQSPIELTDAIEESHKIHNLGDAIEHAAHGLNNGIQHFGDKVGDAWDNVKDFFEGLGH